MGLEPTTFELEVQHASPLRHGGFTKYPVINLNLVSAISFFFFHSVCLLFSLDQNITYFPFNIFTVYAS